MALEYASSSWSPWCADSNIKKLQGIQNSALRSIAGLYMSCPEDFLHLETGIKPLKQRFEDNDDITWDRFARLPDHDQRRQLQLKDANIRLKTRIGWRKKTADRMRNLAIDRDITTPDLPPWKKPENLLLDRVVLDKPKQEYTSAELLQLASAKIESIERELTIYTDGSTDENQENGGAGVYIEDLHHESIYEASLAAGKLCSSYTGECVALLHALEWLQEHHHNALICTDSLSLHSALEQNNHKDRDPWLKNIKKALFQLGTTVTLLWIPSHCDIPGNDKADELAKQGSEMNQEGVPVTHAIVKAKIKARTWPINHQRAQQTYKNSRKPKVKIEKKWPRGVRSLYARLRTGHAKELKSYRHRIGLEEDGICSECELKEETIDHVLCRCPANESDRRELWPDDHTTTTVNRLVTDPARCRELLERRFAGLSLPDPAGSDDE